MTLDNSTLAAEWLPPEDAAALLGVSLKTLQKWRCSGGGPAFAKFGRVIRYPRSELSDWMLSRIRASTSEPRKAA